MLNLLSVSLEAHREPNIHRAYQLRVDQDLLGKWSVEIRFGRTGREGRTIRYLATSEADARAVVKMRLKRRLSAPRRIGTSYKIVDFAVVSLIGVAQDWLPAGFAVAERSRAVAGDVSSRSTASRILRRPTEPLPMFPKI